MPRFSSNRDPTRAVGDRIAPGSIGIGNRPIIPEARYRIVTLANNFFAKNATPGDPAERLIGCGRHVVRTRPVLH
jgi:hypothetical protein